MDDILASLTAEEDTESHGPIHDGENVEEVTHGEAEKMQEHGLAPHGVFHGHCLDYSYCLQKSNITIILTMMFKYDNKLFIHRLR